MRKELSMKVNVKELHNYCVSVLKFVGMPKDEADIFAEILIHADQRGVKSHGVMAFMRYVGLIEKGYMAAEFSYATVVDNPVISVWNANRSCAHVAGYYAMKAAIEKAKTYGIGFVGVNNSNHFGAAAYYAKQASDAGMIGIASSTASPTMAPWGGKEKQIGNNPLALSAPAAKAPAVTLDMAQSVVAYGKISNIITQGIPEIPEGWAYDKQGIPTEKTNEVYSLIPMGKYKGFGTSFFIDIISGMLIGGATGERCGDSIDGSSHTFMAINPPAFGTSLDDFKKQLDDRVDEFKSCPKKDGVDEIYMPGEIEEICYGESLTEAEIIDEVVDQLNALAARLGCEARVKK